MLTKFRIVDARKGSVVFFKLFSKFTFEPNQDNLGKIAGAAVGISLFEIGVIVLSFILAKQYAKKDEFYRNLAWQLMWTSDDDLRHPADC